MGVRARTCAIASCLVLALSALGGCDSGTERCAQNLHQIGQALHRFHDTEGAFPLAAISDKDGRPGLSWRVAILPHLGEQALYARFHLDEPWDSPHNHSLLKAMPAVYGCPGASPKESWLTLYRAFTGKDAFFLPPYDSRFKTVWWEDPDGTKHYHPAPTHGATIAVFMDGRANTLMVVEANEPVPWTKPEGLEFNVERARASLLGAGSPHRGLFNALFVDGAVRAIKTAIDPKVFRALVTRNGGEIVREGDY
jgi:prepilin-type processing-associated H-X9-DG protein